MRKVIFSTLFLTSLLIEAQIVPCFTNEGAGSLMPFRVTNFNLKYLQGYDQLYYQNSFTLLNSDGSFYKTVILPPKPDSSALAGGPTFITASLFDNDSTTLEYVLFYSWDSSSYIKKSIEIVREDGTVLLNEINAHYPNAYAYDFGSSQLIFSTPEGPKMKLEYSYAISTSDYKTTIFSLPGKLPTHIKSPNDDYNFEMNIYPNPNSGVFYITTNKVSGTRNIEIYSIEGRKVFSLQSSDNPSKIISKDIPDGTYVLRMLDSNEALRVKKVIIKK
jgi:hypothetical protein